MTVRPCPIDGADLAPGAVICRGCTNRVRLALRDVPDLLRELDVSIARQRSSWRGTGTRGGRGNGCPDGCDHGPDDPRCVEGVTEDIGLRAAAARYQLVDVVLHGWIRILEEERPPPPGVPDAVHLLRARLLATSAGQAALLAQAMPWISGREWAGEMARQVIDAVRQARAAIDRAPDAALVGRCPRCEASLYGTDSAATVRCRSCGTRHNAADLHKASLAQITTPMPAVDVALLLRINPDRVYQWKRRDRIKPVGVNGKGQPLYRVADGQALLEQGEPEEENAHDPQRPTGDDGEEPGREAAAGVHAP